MDEQNLYTKPSTCQGGPSHCQPQAVVLSVLLGEQPSLEALKERGGRRPILVTPTTDIIEHPIYSINL